jgi:hypothetical protein
MRVIRDPYFKTRKRLPRHRCRRFLNGEIKRAGLIRKESTLMKSDFKKLLRVFNALKDNHLIGGGYAAMPYSQPRATKELEDIAETRRTDS